MSAHRSQSTTDEVGERGLAWMLRLPRPLFRLVFGREWFIEDGRRPPRRPLDDVLATLRSPAGGQRTVPTGTTSPAMGE